jgi:hypothetical protein
VCGCDGVTYNNECQAYAEGKNIKKQGSCGNDEDEEEVIKSS